METTLSIQKNKVTKSNFILNKLTKLFLVITLFNNSIIFAQAGALDLTFNPGTGANGDLSGMCIQPNGKILIGGSFTIYNGTARSRIARLNVDGSLDLTFAPGAGANSTTYGPVLQTDGKIIIFGNFTTYKGVSRPRIARINTDGSLDVTFLPGTGANNWIYAAAIQLDGKIIIAGNFTTYNGTAVPRIARLNTNGTLDLTFNSGTGFNNYPYSISTQSDGKMIIGGSFLTYNGTARSKIVRINIDGSLDASFDPGTGASSSASIIYSTALQNDGKIIIGGSFTSYNGTTRNRLARLNTDGTLDISFNPTSGASNIVYSASVESDNKIIIGGSFTLFNGSLANRIACINDDGSLNTNFNTGTGASNIIYANAIQGDGNIIIGGALTTFNGTGRSRIARLNRACLNATLPILSANNLSICEGLNSVLTISSGTLNDAINWQWYSGSCGGTSVGSGTNIVVSPTVTTIYYARGEGSCTTPSSCSNITITVNPLPVISSISSNTSICIGASTTSTISATGGTGLISYNWMPGNLSGSSQVLAPPSSPSIYTITATDALGCSTLTNQTISLINCPGPQLTPSSCGATLTALDQALSFTSMSGATNYRLEIINAQQPFNTVNVRGNNLTTFKMSWVTGIQYGRTYNIRIAAYVGGIWQSYGNTCTITTPASVIIPTTQFSSGSCNVTLTSLDQQLNFALVSGATNYKFEIINPSQPFNVVNIRNNTVSNFKMSWVPGIQYGRAYDIRISAYVNSTWQPYGSTCTITTPATIPATQLSAGSCGATVSSLSQIINFNSVPGASNYKVEVVNVAQPLNIISVRNNALTTFALSYISGTQTGRTYDLRVAAYAGGVWSAFGPMCQVIVAGPKADGDVKINARKENKSPVNNNQEIFINLFPNPTNGEINIESSESIKSIMIYNLTGELIASEENSNQINLNNFANGLYIIHIKTTHDSKIFRVNKE